MLDIIFIRENREHIEKAAKNKNRKIDLDTLLRLDDERRMYIKKIETLRNERNAVNKDKNADASKGRQLKMELKQLEEKLRTTEQQFEMQMLTIPNVPHESVPIGIDASGNKVIKTHGTPPTFSFHIKDHIELAKSLDLIDFERGAKVGGSRVYFLKNEAAQMELALMWYTLNKLTVKGYTPLIAPSLVREFTLFGNGQFPWGRDEVYKMEKDDVYLAGTAEVPVTAYFADEMLSEKDLPRKFVAFSPCYRREAGSYGKDTRGAYRVHQFNKIEQVIIGKNDIDESLALHEELLTNSEEILKDLKLPYQVLLMCTGDMGEPQIKKYDVETWMPGRGGYGETMSNSFMGDFQARRLKIRYKTTDGQTKYCHTLNNTALASPRILVAILENYQNEDGSITVPEVLRAFLGKEKIHKK